MFVTKYRCITLIDVVIPPKKNRKDQCEYDKYLYKFRHLVENAFLQLEGWRGIATRYAKKKQVLFSCGADTLNVYVVASPSYLISCPHALIIAQFLLLLITYTSDSVIILPLKFYNIVL